MIHPDLVKSILLQNKLVNEKDLDELIINAKQRNVNLLSYIVSQNVVKEADLYKVLSQYFGVEYMKLDNATIPQHLVELLPQSLAQTKEVVIFEHDASNNVVKVATTDPQNLQTIDFIRKKVGLSVQVYLTSPDGIDHVIQQYHKHIEDDFESFQKPLEGGELSSNDIAADIPIIKIFDTLLDYAVFQGASDVHIEPTEKDIIIRFRVDGVLKEVMTLPKNVQSGLLARIKILAQLKIDEHRVPQDGRITMKTEQGKVSLRVSTLPVYDGEKVVMRILKESGGIMTLEQLGFNEKVLPMLQRHIQKPHGMILVTGPTGSGKTTSLYTMMGILNTPERNISTVEDPIEYRMPRINQSQMRSKIGFTFAAGLRSLLRQDPDVIMVGEIRDNETAQIASHAAMTGHLVLSTLHTNDSVATVFRLSEMDIPLFLIASTVNIVLGQRLVRKICKDCIERYRLTPKELEDLAKSFDLEDVVRGMQLLNEVIPETGLAGVDFFRGRGCVKCSDSGYRGRLGIYEAFEMTERASKAILQNASKQQLSEVAQDDGMINMVQDGFVKAKRGLTTIEEIIRVTQD